MRTHTAVAAAVAQGRADVGVGVRFAAEAYGLDFIPIGWEQYDLVVRKDAFEKALQLAKAVLKNLPRGIGRINGREKLN